MPDFQLLLDRLVNVPLLAHPEKAQVVASVVLRRAGVDISVNARAEFVAAPAAGPLQERRMVQRYAEEPYLVDRETGIAVIQITGSLAHRQGYIGQSSGVMGYDGLGAQFQAAIENPSIKGIILDIHSAGGEVSGAFQLADRIAAGRGRKPIVAISDEMAYSAAYLLCAAADEVWLASNTAAVGSIGVVVVHLSFEKMLAMDGVKPTIIHAGARKADGNLYEDMSDEVRGRIQEKVDFVYAEFVSRIAAWRKIDETRVRATEAETFMGPDAIAAGLADGIADPVEVFQALAQQVASPTGWRMPPT